MKFQTQKKALFIVHQKRSNPGDVGYKLLQRGFYLDIKRPFLGEKLPNDLMNYDLVIIFGGPMSINDNNDFIKDEIDWISVVLKSNIPFLGICLGAQMLAKNLGGCVECCEDKSYEIGFFDVIPTIESNKLFENQKTFFQWHNEGFTVPKDCVLLAKGNKFRQQAFQYKNAFGLQFHPEVNLKLHTSWLYNTLLSSPKKLMNKGTQNLFKQMSLRIRNDNSVKNWLDIFLDNFLIKKNN